MMMMFEQIENFYAVVEKTIDKVKTIKKLQTIAHPIANVVISGMGSSFCVAQLVYDIVYHYLKVPITVNNQYTLPNFVNEHTLLIIISYSGDTDESIQVFKSGLQREAHIIVITSGGGLQTLGHLHHKEILLIPKGLLSRTALGASLVYALFCLDIYNLHKLIDGDNLMSQLSNALFVVLDKEFSLHNGSLRKKAEAIASKIDEQKLTPIIYAPTGYKGVCLRFCQQFNENAKVFSFYQTITEVNHNGIVPWESNEQKNLAILFIRDDMVGSNFGIQENFTEEILKTYNGNQLFIIKPTGAGLLSRFLYLIRLADWISYYLAQNKGIDPVEVKAIDQIKGLLLKKRQPLEDLNIPPMLPVLPML